MENIDITSSEFSLGNIPDFTNIMSNTGGGSDSIDYTTCMYVGIAILVIAGTFIIYKFYINKSKQVHFNEQIDCTGGFCTMGSKE
jgi:Na+/H+ antiporter NhaD/arsenite permease-like protein